jgi:hypothetical protein
MENFYKNGCEQICEEPDMVQVSAPLLEKL